MTAPKKAALATPKLTAPELALAQGAVDRCALRQHLEPFHEAVKELQRMNQDLDEILKRVEPRKPAKKATGKA